MVSSKSFHAKCTKFSKSFHAKCTEFSKSFYAKCTEFSKSFIFSLVLTVLFDMQI